MSKLINMNEINEINEINMNEINVFNVLHSSIVSTKAIYLKRKYNKPLPKELINDITTHQIEYIYKRIFSKHHIERLTKLYFTKDKSLYHNEVSSIVNKYIVGPQLSIFKYNENTGDFLILPIEDFKKSIHVRVAAQQKGIISKGELSQKPIPTQFKKKQYINMKNTILKQEETITNMQSKMKEMSTKFKGWFEFHQQIAVVLSQYNECIDTGNFNSLKEIKVKWEAEYKKIIPDKMLIVNEFTSETSITDVYQNYFSHYANMMDLVMDYNDAIEKKNNHRLEHLQKSWDSYILGIEEDKLDKEREDSESNN